VITRLITNTRNSTAVLWLQLLNWRSREPHRVMTDPIDSTAVPWLRVWLRTHSNRPSYRDYNFQIDVFLTIFGWWRSASIRLPYPDYVFDYRPPQFNHCTVITRRQLSELWYMVLHEAEELVHYHRPFDLDRLSSSAGTEPCFCWEYRENTLNLHPISD